jgi:DNA-binding CsgD family transcriptional regulator
MNNTAFVADVLQRVGSLSVLLDARGRAMFIHPALTSGRWQEMIVFKADRVSARHPPSDAALQKILLLCMNRTFAKGSEECRVLIGDPLGGRPVIGECHQLPFGEAPPEMRSAQVLIRLVDPWQAGEVSPEALQLLGLTPHESRVGVLLARSLRPAEIAAELGMTVGTVRTTLHGIYEKLEIRGQPEFVRIALNLSSSASQASASR